MRKTTEQFVEEATKTHGDVYTYDRVKYLKGSVHVVITCREHGDFLQTPTSHLAGRGCQICGSLYGMKQAVQVGAPNPLTKTTEQFVAEANAVHGGEYLYRKTRYINRKCNVVIICTEHGDFLMRAFSHLAGGRCPKCTATKVTNIERAKRREMEKLRNKERLDRERKDRQEAKALEKEDADQYTPEERAKRRAKNLLLMQGAFTSKD